MNREPIRKAAAADASRLAEILIFTKRTHYRRIFRDDRVSFGEMQVYPLALDYLKHPEKLETVWVYDDGIVKGLLHAAGGEALGARRLWVLEENTRAVRFYRRYGFALTGARRLEAGTEAYIVEMARPGKDEARRSGL
ncbi:MAG: GNAT family N-acetyltransferase [Oscillospiraceae bacterium]|nr:GNAT family N-acetyltransferase [Oscillospiraceae bacterium]